ncbi:hypothetical protein [Meridianimarinicoccus aquatilis]|uniref:Uncharacterized protein n=1 Tax=Meridianimarinicoccus aquatilis TaxID=2552766 RepID=A0A4R6AZK5_9RHOB|nr:hypothetical protein [Fluviibacterium aquatile]QIE40967.1 hypothetical protein G5B39_02715 [Rhodobacteraceae bacterium SC52]TDL89275.1 hypothetical protein E2L05_07455 [Fluviibacterium aquatile]
MTRHILDDPRKHVKSGMKLTMSYMAQNRMPRAESMSLHRRPVTRPVDARLREFARIDRGHMA